MTNETHEEGRDPAHMVSPKWVWGTFFGTIVVVVLSVVWSTKLMNDTRKEIGAKPPTKVAQSIGPRDIGMIDQSNIDHDQYGLRLERAQAKRLNQWGWVDKRNGIARIPIKEAVKAVIEENQR